MARFARPEGSPDYPALEQAVLARWQADGTFERSVEARRGCEPFIFYDGPPFANGHPHYGHIMTSYIKDTIPRYRTMRGFLVERRWGWDCHGLPVELDAQSRLGLNGVREINDYGVGAFNEACRESVFTYADEWRRVIDRIGRWVDWDDQYRTMDLSYMETVMHIFATLWRDGLIYESFKVLAYCTSCQTPLSNFETRLDDSYRDREDPTVTVRLPLRCDPSTSLLVWTTTPWTLPSNVLAAVSADLDYETWESPDGSERVVLAAAARPGYEAELDGWTLAATDKGDRWAGQEYEPIFDYFADTPRAFRVVVSDIVTEGEGTGIVHMAPAFGEDDSKIAKAEAVEGPMPVADDGAFDSRVSDFAGMHVLDANPHIETALARSGRLFAASPYVHPYPHCWRCDNPLIYRANDSWMLAIDKLRDRLQASNHGVDWIPEHVGPGAMGNGIDSAPDWALTRNRFWGSPIPVWVSDGTAGDLAETGTETEYEGYGRNNDGALIFVPGSIDELEAVSRTDVTDLHRPFIDEITWPAPDGSGAMRRVPDVLDCWFESGSMPFAQNHWPFAEGARSIAEMDYPADFIVEYIGQVRGWFYTLLVIATALSDESSFKSCLAHGILLGEDGLKLSKRLKNYPDPNEVLDTWGSDALRASILSAPIVRGGNSPVSVQAVIDATRSFMAPITNAYTFFATYAESAGYEGPSHPLDDLAPSHPLDRYILAAVDELGTRCVALLDATDIAGAYEELRLFFDSLTNWYIRLSRTRFWAPSPPLDAQDAEAFDTLYCVLWRVARIAAPLLPFLADWLADELGGNESVHLDDWPGANPAWSDPALLAENDLVRRVVALARAVRADAGIPNRQPLARILVVGADTDVLSRFEDVLRSELNVKDVAARSDAGEIADKKISPDPRALGPRLGGRVQEVLKAARNGEGAVNDDGTATVAGETLSTDEFAITLVPASEDLGVAADRELVVALDLEIDADLELEGFARLLVRHIQNLRKTAGLDVSDRIRLGVGGGDVAERIVDRFGDYVAAEVLAVEVSDDSTAFEQTGSAEIGGEEVTFGLGLAR